MSSLESLDQVIDSNDIVILDPSCLPSDMSSSNGECTSLTRHFSSISGYSSVNIQFLDECLGLYQRAAELLSKPSVVTIPQISREIGIARKPLVSMHRAIQRRGKNSKRQRFISEKIRELDRRILEVQEISRRAELDLCDPKYEALAQMVNDTNCAAHIKGDGYNSRLYDGKRIISYKGPRISNDTDERIVATALFLSMYGYSPAVASRDKHLIHLFRQIPAYLGSEAFAPYNRDFIEGAFLSGFRFYFQYKGGPWELAVDKNSIHRIARSVIRKRDDDYFNEIMQGWKKFNQVPLPPNPILGSIVAV